ncbi:hypothetical protein L0657_18175 [Dyadobacter sp. CY345]|uniref:hypothetical protein n=1 Tax=Dyadobacter sp. CY345 TaxID=2909335 RepID=UPI001F1F3B71|nr:hypothetical protein [Dyadobacter sp. CY345]MCF2445894.1 hypothetical protein [Dyadobacter sp. CY345]
MLKSFYSLLLDVEKTWQDFQPLELYPDLLQLLAHITFFTKLTPPLEFYGFGLIFSILLVAIMSEDFHNWIARKRYLAKIIEPLFIALIISSMIFFSIYNFTLLIEEEEIYRSPLSFFSLFLIFSLSTWTNKKEKLVLFTRKDSEQ